MFEKVIDIFLQEANPNTKPLPISTFPEYFKVIRNQQLQETIKDESSFDAFKSKMIDMEKTLNSYQDKDFPDFRKLILPLIAFAKVYTNFCLLDSEYVHKNMNCFPNMIFTNIFKFLSERISKNDDESETNDDNEEKDAHSDSSPVDESKSEEIPAENKQDDKETTKETKTKTRGRKKEIQPVKVKPKSLEDKGGLRKNKITLASIEETKAKFFDLFSDELAELLFEINEAIEQNSLIVGSSSTSKLFHHVVTLIFHEKLPEFPSFQQKFYKYLANICIFLYAKTPDENDQKLVLEEVFLLMQQPMKSMNHLNIELDATRTKINVLSYFFLKLPQSTLFSANLPIQYTKKNELTDSSLETVQNGFVSSLKIIRNVVGYLFKKSKEDLKNKTNIQKFIRVFINDILATLKSPEIVTSLHYHHIFAGIVIESLHHKGETDSMFKTFLLDFIKGFLLSFIEMEEFLESKNHKLSWKIDDNEKMASTSTKSKNKKSKNESRLKAEENKENDKNMLCDICKTEIFDEDNMIEGLEKKTSKTTKQVVCLYCYLDKIIEELDLPNKADFNRVILVKTPINPMYFQVLLHGFNENSLKSTKFHAARQFFLSDWLNLIMSKGVIKKSYIPILESQISTNFNPKTAITFMNAATYEPSEFLVKYIRLSLIFSDETKKISSAFKSSLLLLSNESTSIRNKVLEVVQAIMQQNPQMIFNEKIRDIITQRVQDSMVSVRSNALNIIMKYYEMNDFIEDTYYFEKLLERLNDIDSGLRKRILNFFMSNVKILKKRLVLMDKVLKATVFKIYDNEEVSILGLNLICGLIFEGFVEKDKKPAKNKKKDKEKLEDDTMGSGFIKNSIKVVRNLCMELKNSDWLSKVIKHSATQEDGSKDEIKGFIELLINELAARNNNISQESLVDLEMLQAFSKYYSIILSQELNFLSNYLKCISEMKKTNNKPLSELLFIRKQQILMLLEMLDTLLIGQNEDEVKSKSFIDNFKEIEQMLIKFVQEEALEILHKALKLLISSVKKATENYFIIKNIYVQTYAFVLKKKATLDENTKEGMTADNIQHFMRSLYILTFLTRYFDISEFFEEEEKEKPEFQEENLIKIIYNELIFFCKYKHPIIEQTCIECLMILWEKLPILIFETRSFIEKYLADVSEDNREIIENIFVCFLNILLRHEEKIRRQNSLNRNIKRKIIQDQEKKKKKKGKNLKDLEDSEESEEELLFNKSDEPIDEKDFEKLAVMIREMTKANFTQHIFSPDANIRKKILQLLQTLIIQGHVSSYEFSEYFICFLTDSNQEIRTLCEEMLKTEWKNNRLNFLSSLNKGVRRGYEYLVKRGGKASPFVVDGDDVKSLYLGINRIMAKGNEEIENHFPVLLIENYSLYSKPSDRTYLQFICSLILTLEEYSVWEAYEVLVRLFAMISKNFYKSVKTIKGKAVKKENKNILENSGQKSSKKQEEQPPKEEKKQELITSTSKSKNENLEINRKEKNEEILLKEDVNNCFNLLIELLTFHLFIIHSKGFKEICNVSSCTMQEIIDKLERHVKKNPSTKQKEGVEAENEANKKKNNFNIGISFEVVGRFEEFIEKNLEVESFLKNKENVYLLYKKIKFLFNYKITEDLDVLFSFDQEMLEKYREETNLWSKKKSKRRKNSEEIDKKVSKTKKNKNVLINEENTKVFMEKKKPKKKKEEKTVEVEIVEKRQEYKGRLRKRELKNMNEEKP